MIKLKTVNILGLVLLSGCGQSRKEQADSGKSGIDVSDITKNLAGSEESKKARFAFMNSNVIVILAKEFDGDSTKITIQDFKDDSGSFIPIFTSQEKYVESSKGNKLGVRTLEINPVLMLSVMKDTDRIRINPGLPDDSYFDVKDLKLEYSSEIEALNNRLRSK